ncbi:sensor histidine kinase [Formosa haliotis]|uniref:sensor histidine kinase n=1 Tax=Formosa haliotis TaxID=1555194 RepID=UPI0008256C8F|nr:histidine kinase [Formosa haliotis]
MVQPAEQIVSTAAERYLLVYMTAVLLVVCTLIIIFFITFQKRKNKLLRDKIEQQRIFDEEISRTQIEIQEQTLKHIGQELHDNVGQLLSVAFIQLGMLGKQIDPELEPYVSENKDLVKESLDELRAISKSLNGEVVMHRGFQDSINNEIKRFNKLGRIDAEVIIEGDSSLLENKKDGMILFRIFQEFLSNTLKYSEASHLKTRINYTPNCLMLYAEDDGVGFDINKIEQGSGLINMESRAALINAHFKLKSKPDQGVSLQLKYPYRKV